MKRTTLLLLAVGAASCRSGAREAVLTTPEPVLTTPAEPPAAHVVNEPRDILVTTRVGFTPKDMTTNAGSSISVWLDDGGAVVDPKSVEAVRGSITLRTYPDLANVPFTVKTRINPLIEAPPDVPKGTVVKATPPVQNPGRVSLDIVPSAPLAARWYVVGVDNLPETAVGMPSQIAAPVKLGATYARFNPKSDPVLDRVAICDKAGKSSRVVAHFTEPVTLNEQSAKLLEVSGNAGEKCNVVIPQIYGTSLPGQDNVYLDCPASLWSSPRMTLKLRQGLTSAASSAAVGVFDEKGAAQGGIVKRTAEHNAALDFAAAREVESCRNLSAM
ncbi:MAG: hypothetical protein ABW133_25720 [Polyangiaceae bacterium]